METDKLIKAIAKATNGTFIGDNAISTLIGYIPQYDEEGRILTADPNYVHSYVNICDTKYAITKSGWYVYIWKPKYTDKVNYTMVWDSLADRYLLTKVDLRPDYVKEWEEKQHG